MSRLQLLRTSSRALRKPITTANLCPLSRSLISIPLSTTSASSSSRPHLTRLPSCSTRPYSTETSSESTPPPPLDGGEKAIYDKLSATFPGKRLEVQDVSGGCGSFYAILISSPAFKGLSTIKQHKLVNACLKEDIKTIHGLQLKTIPEE